jgi:hypothetical protein
MIFLVALQGSGVLVGAAEAAPFQGHYCDCLSQR